MKSSRVGGLAVTLMLITGGAVYAVTPAGGFFNEPPSSQTPAPAEPSATEAATAAVAPTNPAAFVIDKTVRVDARLGHREAARQGGAETYVMLELKGADVTPSASAPVHLGLVIDRSGSMRGKRFDNARSSAIAAIDRLVDGDTVSLVTFDTRTETVVPPTEVNASTRPSLRRSVESIVLGGDTCISCGIETMTTLMAGTPTLTRRMIVLSDGDATAGVRDVDEMRSLARRARAAGVTVSGIGVDLQYNERMMAAVAEGGEGQHRFVAEPADLAAVFEAEAASLRQTVAENVAARIRLEPGVELIEVLDRPFARSGSDLIVELGSLTRSEVKTVLCRVRLPASSSAGALPVAAVSVQFRDLSSGAATAVESSGTLAATPAAASSEPDPFVLARVERSETARTLDEANRLFRSGKVDAARARIDARRQTLKKTGGALRPDANDPFSNAREGDAKKDVDSQIGILDRASTGFAPPPVQEKAPTVPGKPRPRPAAPSESPPVFESNARKNKEDAFNSTR